MAGLGGPDDTHMRRQVGQRPTGFALPDFGRGMAPSSQIQRMVELVLRHGHKPEDFPTAILEKSRDIFGTILRTLQGSPFGRDPQFMDIARLTLEGEGADAIASHIDCGLLTTRLKRHMVALCAEKITFMHLTHQRLSDFSYLHLLGVDRQSAERANNSIAPTTGVDMGEELTKALGPVEQKVLDIHLNGATPEEIARATFLPEARVHRRLSNIRKAAAEMFPNLTGL